MTLERSRRGGLLFIRGGAIGDFVLTLPALRLARRSFPGQPIEVLGTPGIVDLARHFGLADAVRRLEDPALARFFVPGAPLDPAWCGYFASFSVVVSYLFDPDDIFHENLARAGVDTLLRGPHRPSEGGPSAAEQLARPLAGLALFPEPGETGTPFLPSAATDPSSSVALHAGSGSPRKNWGLENWTHVATALHQLTSRPLLLLAGEAEAPVLPEFLRTLSAAGIPHSLAENVPLPELAGRLAHCRLFLGHDTGPAHLAAACGLSCVLVFGPTDPAVWAPAGPHVRVLRAPGHSPAALPPSAVIEAAREALGLDPGPGNAMP